MSSPRRVLLALLVLAACGGGATQLERAAKTLSDDAQFVTSASAGQGLNRAAAQVLADANACGKHHGRADSRCAARFQVAAFLQAESIEVTACDRDGRMRIRRAARDALSAVVKVDSDKPPPDAPALLRCPPH